MIYPEILTELEPPGLDDDSDEPDEPCLAIGVWIGEADDTRRAALTNLAPDAPDEVVAHAMVRCMEGAAALRGPGLVEALRWRMQAGGDQK